MTNYIVPDTIEPVVGWKSWDFQEGCLVSPAHPARWKQKQRLRARCSRRFLHKAPHQSCHCGIYIADAALVAFGHGMILGRVLGWGKVIEHQYGWRVQYAYPKEIYYEGGAHPQLLLALQRYGVPVLEMTDERFDLHLNIRKMHESWRSKP